MRRYVSVGGAIVSFMLSQLGPASSGAEANGGTLRLNRAVAGPYWVSAWTQPDPPRVGRIDLSVAVMSPNTGEAILDADARASARWLGGGGGAGRIRLEPGAGGNLLLYHGNLELSAPGRWLIMLEARGAGGSGVVVFEMEVQPARSLTVPLAITLVALGVGAMLWWAWTRRRAAER
jgi:hypothetical protein